MKVLSWIDDDTRAGKPDLVNYIANAKGDGLLSVARGLKSHDNTELERKNRENSGCKNGL